MQCNSCEGEDSKELKCERSNPSETPRSVKKEVGGGMLGMGAEIPLQPMRRSWLSRLSFLSPWRATVRQIHAATHGGSHDRGNGSALKKSCSSWRVRWSRLLADAAAYGEKPTQKLVLWWELAAHGGHMVEQSVV